MNTISKIIVTLFITSLFTSCSADMFNRVNGNKNVISKTRKTSSKFTGIKVSSGIDLYLYQGDKNKITVEADENLHDIIITEVEDGILKVYTEKNIWKAKAKKVYVTITTINSLKASSGSDVYGKDIIKTKMLSVSSSSGAGIKIAVNANNVETSSSSGSSIRISGTAFSHTANASSGASINAFQLESKNVLAKVSSGANIDVYASEKLEAKASSGGSIDFKGNTKNVTKKSSSGGNISGE